MAAKTKVELCLGRVPDSGNTEELLAFVLAAFRQITKREPTQAGIDQARAILEQSAGQPEKR